MCALLSLGAGIAAGCRCAVRLGAWMLVPLLCGLGGFGASVAACHCCVRLKKNQSRNPRLSRDGDGEAIVRPPSVAPSPRHFAFPLLRTLFGEGQARSARAKA